MIKEIMRFIEASDTLLKSDNIEEKEFITYRKNAENLLVKIIKVNYNTDIKENAIKALKPYSEKDRTNFFFKWIKLLVQYKTAWDYNLPFLIGKSKTDFFKRQIFKIQTQLEVIHFKLDKNL